MHIKAYIHALLAILLWSMLAFLGLQLSKMPPFLLVGVALLIGAACSIHKISQWRVSFDALLLGIYGLFGYHFCFFIALRNAPPVEANLINYLWPLFIVILSPLFLRAYSLRVNHILAAFTGLTGAAFIVTGGRFNFNSDYLFGYVLAALSAFIWASYSLMIKRIKPFPNASIGLFCFCSGILSLSMHFLLEKEYVFASGDYTMLLLLGLGPMGAAFYLWNSALKNGDPRIIGSLAYLTPLLSTIILILTGNGSFSFVTIIAMALIIGGAAIGSISAVRPISHDLLEQSR